MIPQWLLVHSASKLTLAALEVQCLGDSRADYLLLLPKQRLTQAWSALGGCPQQGAGDVTESMSLDSSWGGVHTSFPAESSSPNY